MGEQEFKLDGLKYDKYTRMLEVYQRRQEVDVVLAAGVAAGEAWGDRILLGALVNLAADKRDWRRAEDLWQRFVKQYGIKPNITNSTVFAKAQLLCGRIREALDAYLELDEKSL